MEGWIRCRCLGVSEMRGFERACFESCRAAYIRH